MNKTLKVTINFIDNGHCKYSDAKISIDEILKATT